MYYSIQLTASFICLMQHNLLMYMRSNQPLCTRLKDVRL